MRIFGCEICSYKPIIFGDLVAKQFVLFEHKRLFGIIFFYFSGGKQDRFHTHAFNALSIKLFGTYSEGILDYVPSVIFTSSPWKNVRYEKRDKIFKYFPRNCYHSINDSKGCMTMLLQGPWRETWNECKVEITDMFGKDKKVARIVEEKTLTWHRNEVTSS